MFEQRKVGATDVSVSSISFGCSGIANLYVEVSDLDARTVLDCAWKRGIRYFDVAPHYGRGLAEVRLGKFLLGKSRSEFALSTKVGRVLRSGPQLDEADGFIAPLPNAVHYDYSAAGIRESFEGSCDRLGVDAIDIVYVHDIGALTHGSENDRHMKDLFETGLPELERLKSEGRIGAIGLGVNETQVCLDVMARHHLDVILLAGRWTLLDRSAEAELVPLCHEQKTSLVLGGIFNSGILAMGAVDGAHYDYGPAPEDILAKVRRLEKLARQFDTPLATAAMQFGLTRPGVASVLIGTGKTSSLNRNLDALEADFPAPLADLLF
ncbi:aldo/keto reductase [Alphaproteobacteria bacterium KMM 3653]|uniref:Aldo/keto reductase n=1 Tax=Harenicola maris TaxID=2841044 RepID=A0AAP2G7E0_9RHOB|nr:aldo/keto reductase [Harenicola maris]